MPSSSLALPSRHGVHWPQDSSTKNSMKFLATRSMSRCGPKTMIEPPVETSSKASVRRELRGGHAVPGGAADLHGLGVLAADLLAAARATVMPSGNS